MTYLVWRDRSLRASGAGNQHHQPRNHHSQLHLAHEASSPYAQ